MKNAVLLAGITFLISCCLIQSEKAYSYALNGLNLWFQRMLPTLLPFMIISGVMIRMNLSEGFARIFSPLFRPLFHLSDSCLYILIMGFLCGFPMGARVTADSLKSGKITEREAELMLSFCNNIGPIYMTGYVFYLFQTEAFLKWLSVMYLVPLGYGVFLRYTKYRDIPIVKGVDLKGANRNTRRNDNVHYDVNLLQALQESITSAFVSQASLGGNMIFFNLLNLMLDLLIPISFVSLHTFAACLLEISGGISMLKPDQIKWAFVFLQFGGLSCIAQTYSMIQETELKLSDYVFHKIIQAIIIYAVMMLL